MAIRMGGPWMWRYKVVINHEEQYSIWPYLPPVPEGWKDAGFEGSKHECLHYIEEVWTDMRPLSLRKRMDELEKEEEKKGKEGPPPPPPAGEETRLHTLGSVRRESEAEPRTVPASDPEARGRYAHRRRGRAPMYADRAACRRTPTPGAFRVAGSGQAPLRHPGLTT